MQTTMLCRCGVFSSAIKCAAPPGTPERGKGLGRVGEKLAAEIRIDPGPGDGPRAAMRADLVLIGLDNGVERGRIDIAFLDQDGFQRAHAQLHFRQFGAMPVVVFVVAHIVLLPHPSACINP